MNDTQPKQKKKITKPLKWTEKYEESTHPRSKSVDSTGRISND